MSKGFTLIELLVVVLIIGILSAVALPQYTRAVEKARATELITALNTLEKAVDIYVLANGYQTVNLEDLDMLDVTLPIEDGFLGKNIQLDTISCTATSCLIDLIRVGKAGPIGWEIASTKDSATGKWTRNCIVGDDEYSDSLCRSLQSSGVVDTVS